MAEQVLKMADIYMPTPVIQAETIDVFLWVLFVLALMLIFIGWRFYKNPQRYVLRDLKQHKINARTAAHALYKLEKNQLKQKELEALRFSREPPTAKDLLNLIHKDVAGS